MTDINRRKDEHLEIVLAGRGTASGGIAPFDRIAFEHVALPEIDLAAIDLSAAFLGRRLAAPLLISSMTGGPAQAARINASLAEAAQSLGIAIAVGSQRIAIETAADAGFGRDLRRRAHSVPLLANLGASQIRGAGGVDVAQKAVAMIEADALIIHLNPLQEAVQAGGDTNWTGVRAGIEAVCKALPVPVVVKEVGAGISASIATALWSSGVRYIDAAGSGGTSWAAIEAERCPDPAQRAVGLAFRDWGIPTPDAIVQVRKACPDATVIASGGIRSGLDAAKAIRLGADIVGQAAATLPAAIDGPQAVIDHFRAVIMQLRIACFCTGSRTLADLRAARLQAPVGAG